MSASIIEVEQKSYSKIKAFDDTATIKDKKIQKLNPARTAKARAGPIQSNLPDFTYLCGPK
jgi:hypothetical protein